MEGQTTTLLDPSIPPVIRRFDDAGRRNFYITDSGTMMPRSAECKSGVWYIFETYPDFSAIRSDGAHFKWMPNHAIKEIFPAIRNQFNSINDWYPFDGTIPAFCVWLNRQDSTFCEKDLPEQVNVESIRMEMVENSYT